MGKTTELDTIWEVPDGLWAEVKHVLDEHRPAEEDWQAPHRR